MILVRITDTFCWVGKRKFRIFAAQNRVINNLNFTTMAFDFNTVKQEKTTDRIVKIAQKTGPVAKCDLEFGIAKEQGDIWLMFYYHFLKNLYERANSLSGKVPVSLTNRPTNILQRLQDIAKLDKEYCPNDIYAIEQVIEVMQKANDIK